MSPRTTFIKQRLPWWAKIGAKIALSRLPLGYRIWQRVGLFRHGAMDTSSYSVAVFDSHVAKACLVGALEGKTILELGPGDSIATAILAAAHGARAVLVDAGPFVRADLPPYLELVADCRRNGIAAPDISHCSTMDAVLTVCDARYLTEGLASFRALADHSIDFIFSQAVLEHVRLNEFLPLMMECRRVLRPGGIASHRVDLRDHLGGGLNNLRFSERLWESTPFAKSGFYTNRLRATPMVNLFRDAGFEVTVTERRRWANVPLHRSKLNRIFAGLSDEELRVWGIDVILK